MKEQVCTFQNILWETRLKIYVFRCECSKCPAYLNMINKETCKKCSYKIPTDKSDPWMGSLTDTIQKIEERQDQVIEHLLANYCQKCDYYSKETKACHKSDCACAIPVENLMRNSNIHCPLELW